MATPPIHAMEWEVWHQGRHADTMLFGRPVPLTWVRAWARREGVARGVTFRPVGKEGSMARAPKIPGLRGWVKVKLGRGFRTVYELNLGGIFPRLRIAPTPARASEGPIRGYYGLVNAEGAARGTQGTWAAGTATVATKTVAIKGLRAWLREYNMGRANPLTTQEAQEELVVAAQEDAMGDRLARRYGGPSQANLQYGRAIGRRDVVAKRAHFMRRANPSVAYEDLGPGDRVTILVPAGRNRDGSQDYAERTGRVVMRGPAGWVLNLGGRHGTPGIASPENFVRATRGKPSQRHHGFGTLGRRGNPARRYPKASRATKACVAKKIPRYMREGMPQRQAVAAAFSKCRPKRRNPATGTTCRHTLPLQKGGHGKVAVCYPRGVFASLKAAVVNIQRELRAKFGQLRKAPAIASATWAYSDPGRTRGRWTFAG